MLTSPLISVVMPVYNASRYLTKAIDSILNQTYANFEFIILDDCSTDDSVAIVKKYRDERIKLVQQSVNKGVTQNLNEGLHLSKGKYIARMDADDISLPTRFAQQVEFMESNPKVGVCGCWIKYLQSEPTSTLKYPTNHSQVLSHVFFNKALVCHPSVMIRKSILEQYQLRYPTECKYGQDYALWISLLNHCEFANIPQVLFMYRIHSSQVSSQYHDTQLYWQNIYQARFIKRVYPSVTDQDIRFHQEMLATLQHSQVNNIFSIHRWIMKFWNSPDAPVFFHSPYFKKILGRFWLRCCHLSTQQGIAVFFLFFKYPISRLCPIGFSNILKFALDCLLKRKSQYLQ